MQIGFRNTTDELGRDRLIKIVASVSLAAKNLELLNRVRGLFSANHWRLDRGAPITLDPELVKNGLVGRGLPDEKVREFEDLYHRIRPVLDRTDLAIARRVAHGHIAFEMTWCAVAKVLESIGVPHDVVDQIATDQIARGHEDSQRRLAADAWARDCFGVDPNPPNALLDWTRVS
jgi:hypothetical protein